MNIMQTKPLRSYGVDVTYTSLQPILDSLGIDEQVKNLSQAEKEILRYLATLKQASISMGDFANNLESPSNQLKIFKQQLVEAKVALSSLFIGAFAKILPYANAFLMVIKEVSSAIATMFGIELTDYNTGIASQEGIYDGIADSADDASKAVKELKRQTLGFDEIHNINENKNSNSGTSASGGIDQRLLDAITGYDNGMDKVKMKATEIRDKWMEILGFTKHTDEETRKVYFTYDGLSSTVKGLVGWWKKLNTQNKIFIGLGVALVIGKIYTSAKKLINVIGGTGIIKQIKNLNSYIKIYTKLSGNFVDGIAAGTNAFLKQKIVVTDAWGNINKVKTAVNGCITAFTGLIVSATGLGFISDSVKDIANGTSNLLTVIGLVGGTILTIGGALTTVSSLAIAFGTTMSTSMAVATGGISLAVSALVGLITYLTTSKDKTSELTKEIQELKEQNSEMAQSNLVQIEHTKELSKELVNLIDSNGKVKKGYEERVEFILNQLNSAFGTEYELVNDAIYNNGRLVTSYDDIRTSIEKVISTKKAEIILNAYEETYVKALQNRKIKQDELNKKIEAENEELSKLDEQYKNGEISQEIYMTRREETHKKYEKQYKNMREEIKEFQNEIDNYDKLLYASSTGNIDEINEALNKYISTSETAVSNYWKTLVDDSNIQKKCIEDNLNSLNGKNISGTFKLSVNTDGATKTLNEFGENLNNSGLGGLGNIFTGLRFTPAYANGGMPEDGLFFANHNELVGKFSNGKTAVANNGQIIEGIKAGVYEAVTGAMSQFNGGGVAEINVRASKDVIVETAINGINQQTKQTGVCPVKIPA